MLRLSRAADYGVVILAYLASEASRARFVNTGEIAQATGVPPAMASKIVQVLQQRGLLESVRGAKGGYRLARPSSAISIGEVIEALDGAIALTACDGASAGCEQIAHCATSRAWRRIGEALRKALGSVSLADMLDPAFAPRIIVDHGRAKEE